MVGRVRNPQKAGRPTQKTGNGDGINVVSPDKLNRILNNQADSESEKQMMEGRTSVKGPESEKFNEKTDEPNDNGSQNESQPETPAYLSQRKTEVAAQHVEGPMGEVENIQHAEDDREPTSHDH